MCSAIWKTYGVQSGVSLVINTGPLPAARSLPVYMGALSPVYMGALSPLPAGT